MAKPSKHINEESTVTWLEHRQGSIVVDRRKDIHFQYTSFVIRNLAIISAGFLALISNFRENLLEAHGLIDQCSIDIKVNKEDFPESQRLYRKVTV